MATSAERSWIQGLICPISRNNNLRTRLLNSSSDWGLRELLEIDILEYMSKQRSRNKDGQLNAKRFDTKISSIEKKYGVDLGVRGDMKLGNYLTSKGYPSLSKMLKGK